MNLLIDFITVSKKTGAGEYHRRVFNTLMSYIESNRLEVTVFALWDYTKGIAYSDMQEKVLTEKYSICYIDIAKLSLLQIIDKYKIDKFFIACSHYIGNYVGIEEIKCNVVCVVHDICDEEFEDNFLHEYVQFDKSGFYFDSKRDKGWKVCLNIKSPTIKYCRWLIGKRRRGVYNDRMHHICGLLKNNPNARLISVSEYTKNSIIYYFNIPADRIAVRFSPERCISSESSQIDNSQLKQVVLSNVKYYLMVGANRNSKNPRKMIRVFRKFAELYPDSYLVTLGYPKSEFKNHIALPFLSDSDLLHAYKHCYAFLYPSLFEGFGYPPVEAMKWGKPVLASNVTSIPEILGTAVIYFSPFYSSDIFRALRVLNAENYQEYSMLARNQYDYVHKIQEQHLVELIQQVIKI